MKIKFWFLMLCFSTSFSFLVLPTWANVNLVTPYDGVNPKKKNKVNKSKVKKTAFVKKRVNKNRAVVRGLYPTISSASQVVSNNTNPRIPYEIVCSENKLIIVRFALPEEGVFKNGVVIQLADYKNLSRVVLPSSTPSEFITKVGLIIADHLQLESYTYINGNFIFLSASDGVDFDKILFILREKISFLHPFEVKTRYGCLGKDLAISK